MTDTAPDTGDKPNTTTSTFNVATNPVETLDTDPVDEVAKWKELARKHEDRAKANSAAAKELDTLRQQTMSETEKAVTAAKAEGRVEAAREYGAKLVAAELKAAAAGRNVDVEALLEGVDPARFLDPDGDPDVAAITAWIDRVAPQPDPANTQPAPFDLGQGVRPDPSTALNGDPLLRDLKNALNIR